MKKVYQKIVCKGKGDCCRAAMASLFDLDINDMPLFLPDETQSAEVIKFFMERGYDPTYINRTYENGKETRPTLEGVAKHDGGIDGYFYASVSSQTFDGISHAVIVDTDLNIVHDPNPNQLAINLKPEDVEQIITGGNWYIDLDGNIIDE